MMDFVSWDDDIPNISVGKYAIHGASGYGKLWKHKINVPNHQPDIQL
jgi:hypothetical protein